MIEKLFPGTAETMRLRLRQMIFAIIAAVALLIALVYFLMAAHGVLAALYGETMASLALGFVLLLVAVGFVLAARSIDKRLKRKAAAAAAAPSGLMSFLADGLALTGFKREGLAVRAAAHASRGAKPMQYLPLIILGGFLLGRRFDRR